MFIEVLDDWDEPLAPVWRCLIKLGIGNIRIQKAKNNISGFQEKLYLALVQLATFHCVLILPGSHSVIPVSGYWL